ncbi:MAG: hypothetical protein NC131_17945 [Roseburia sp.]|nr:hypothetical protein [Roseburia sp.]
MVNIETDLQIPVGFGYSDMKRIEKTLDHKKRMSEASDFELYLANRRCVLEAKTPVVSLRTIDSNEKQDFRSIVEMTLSVIDVTCQELYKHYMAAVSVECYSLEFVVNRLMLTNFQDMVEFYGIDIIYKNKVVHMQFILPYFEEYRIIQNELIQQTTFFVSYAEYNIKVVCDRFKLSDKEEVWQYKLYT